MARAELLAVKDATRVWPENPEGFKYRYEKKMYDTSPLRFASFDEAINELDSFAKLIGMAPNNDIRQPDAKVADQRAEKGQFTNLTMVEGSAIGRQCICTPSDLALLVHAFADSSNSQTVRFSSVPAPIRVRLLSWMDPNFPDGTAPRTKPKPARPRSTRRAGSSRPPTVGAKKSATRSASRASSSSSRSSTGQRARSRSPRIAGRSAKEELR
jgi:hypothetical protein